MKCRMISNAAEIQTGNLTNTSLYGYCHGKPLAVEVTWFSMSRDKTILNDELAGKEEKIVVVYCKVLSLLPAVQPQGICHDGSVWPGISHV
jgi:hypothetical protein